MLTKEYYSQNKQYGSRYTTDAQAVSTSDGRSYGGVMDRQARFIEKNQLFDREAWGLFVHQFRTHSDTDDIGWRGEYFGKMMRGASMTYQYTRNEELYSLLTETAEEMLAVQDEMGRFSTYTLEREFNGWDLWSRKYVILGFLHYHEICRDGKLRQRIEEALMRHLDYVVEHIYGNRVDLSKTAAHWGGINSASILEPTMRMYNLTGKQSYLDFAEYIIDFLTNGKMNIFAQALKNEILPYQYPVVKAYEMMSCFEGLIEYYRATGKEWCKTAVINFVEAVAESDISIIGCAGCKHELFNHTAAMQTDTDYKGIMQETCVTVTWMKLCNQLLMLTGEAKYADRIERSLYNALYGAINSEKVTVNGGYMFDSYSPLTLGVRGRVLGGNRDISPTRRYGCCVAIGAAGTALPLLTAVTATKKGITVNYYEKGTVSLDGIELKIETEYPIDPKVIITVTKGADGEWEIALRIPYFSGADTKLLLNGEAYPFEAKEGEGFYATINREWTEGDRIELNFDMSLRILRPMGVEGKPETKDFFAVMYGPLVLARDARVSEVGTAVKLSERLGLTPQSVSDVDCLFGANVTIGNETLPMIDYGSAGKTWSEESLTEAWIKTE